MTSRAAQLDDALSLGSPAKSIELLLTSRKYFVHLAALLLLGDAALCALIIRFVSCESHLQLCFSFGAQGLADDP